MTEIQNARDRILNKMVRASGITLFTVGATFFYQNQTDYSNLRQEYLSRHNEVTPEVRNAADSYARERADSEFGELLYIGLIGLGAYQALPSRRKEEE